MSMSRDQHPGKNHDIKIGNTYFERVEQLRHLGKRKHQFPLMKKLRSNGSQGMLVTIRCRIFCLSVC
jgi:hypothetical protein